MCAREKRVHNIAYSCDDRQDLAERIVNLEESLAAQAVASGRGYEPTV